MRKCATQFLPLDTMFFSPDLDRKKSLHERDQARKSREKRFFFLYNLIVAECT